MATLQARYFGDTVRHTDSMRAETATLQLVHINVGGGFGFVYRSTLASQKPGV